MAKQDLRYCVTQPLRPLTSQYILGKSDKITHSSWLSSLFRTAVVIILNLPGHRRQSHCKSAHSKPARDTIQKLFLLSVQPTHKRPKRGIIQLGFFLPPGYMNTSPKIDLFSRWTAFAWRQKKSLRTLKFWKSQPGVILGAQCTHSHRP